MVTVIEQHLYYLPGVYLCFEDFNGQRNSKQLVTYLIDKASTSDGTQLVVAMSREYVHQNNKS